MSSHDTDRVLRGCRPVVDAELLEVDVGDGNGGDGDDHDGLHAAKTSSSEYLQLRPEVNAPAAMSLGVFGSGYAGVISAVCLAELGHTVTAIDLNRKSWLAYRRRRRPYSSPGSRSSSPPTLMPAGCGAHRARRNRTVVSSPGVRSSPNEKRELRGYRNQ
jgi:hypothetical protein